MNALLSLALHSLWNRRTTMGLTLLAIAMATALLIGVERIRLDAREAFTRTVSGTDLIVGARTAPTQLLLYSVFRIGDPLAGMSWDSYRALAEQPMVAWSIPLSLGDAYRGYPVLGTDANYLEHFRHGDRRPLVLATGRWFDGPRDAVLGSAVARDLDLEPGAELVLSHGTHAVSFVHHDDHPFRVTGVLAPTGTPVDRTVHVSLAGIEAMHAGFESGVRLPGDTHTPAQTRADAQPEQITAALLGLRTPVAALQMQRMVVSYRREALTAILPGPTLRDLWRTLGMAEDALRAVSVMVAVAGLLGMLASLLASLQARRRELAILRALGARPLHLFGLLGAEAALTGLGGAALGVLLVQGMLLAARDWLRTTLGMELPPAAPGLLELGICGAVVLAATLAGLIPAWQAYRISLADGMTPRI